MTTENLVLSCHKRQITGAVTNNIHATKFIKSIKHNKIKMRIKNETNSWTKPAACI